MLQSFDHRVRRHLCWCCQLKLAETLSVDRKTLASAIVSVAVTCGDCGDHLTATQYYERELALWKGESPSEVGAHGLSLHCSVPYLCASWSAVCCAGVRELGADRSQQAQGWG